MGTVSLRDIIGCVYECFLFVSPEILWFLFLGNGDLRKNLEILTGGIGWLRREER